MNEDRQQPVCTASNHTNIGAALIAQVRLAFEVLNITVGFKINAGQPFRS